MRGNSNPEWPQMYSKPSALITSTMWSEPGCCPVIKTSADTGSASAASAAADGSAPPAVVNLKDVLQNELHDSRFSGRGDLAKSPAAEVRRWIQAAKAVGQIERLPPEFQPLRFP